MRLLMIGMSHRTAGIELREQVAVTPDALPAWLTQFCRDFSAAGSHLEAAMLSTCNRTELYVARPTHSEPTHEQMIDWLAKQTQTSQDAVRQACVLREQDAAVRHLFRVACGLESMVLGEPQILGQVRRAYEAAHEADTLGVALHRLFQQAVATARTARNETGIGNGATSVGAVAVRFAQQIFEHFDDKTIVSLGAGEMTKAMLRCLADLSPGRLPLVNRTPQRAAEMAAALENKARAEARPWESLDELIVDADILLTCTGSSEPILKASQFNAIARRRRHRPLLIVDIAVPRDVEPQVGGFANVYLYNLDDLQEAASGAAAQRAEAIAACESLIEQRVESCLREVQHQDVGQIIRQLRHRLGALGEQESQRTQRKLESLLPDGHHDPVAQMLDEHTRRLINKILHLPLSQLDPRDHDAPLGYYAAALRRLFDLDEKSDD